MVGVSTGIAGNLNAVAALLLARSGDCRKMLPFSLIAVENFGEESAVLFSPQGVARFCCFPLLMTV